MTASLSQNKASFWTKLDPLRYFGNKKRKTKQIPEISEECKTHSEDGWSDTQLKETNSSGEDPQIPEVNSSNNPEPRQSKRYKHTKCSKWIIITSCIGATVGLVTVMSIYVPVVLGFIIMLALFVAVLF